MKYFGRDIATLSDWELIIAYGNCEREDAKRAEASKHEKFTKVGKAMAFPTPNPEFLKIKTELLNEIKSRKLDIKQ